MCRFRVSASTSPFQPPALATRGSGASGSTGVDTVISTSSPSLRILVTSGSRGSNTPLENRARMVRTIGITPPRLHSLLAVPTSPHYHTVLSRAPATVADRLPSEVLAGSHGARRA